ncbi:RNA polymerase-binding protein RbpA [Micromonospora olivasterospora]|uniref:RNA polymerase-binding protein RbpA n=1 Tax=Micromonospora olivasterospora TaxID=1880 RepID=A0A562I3H0_MICOL|nr:RNA polymerase-binding protein RbpA [Micromonospora olivasterospora]TWH65550.1 RNA polymerase binding protein RbpA [Micromonospora olivasterospora]
MASGNVIRGARVGSGPQRPGGRHEAAPRREVSYWCRERHRVDVPIAADVGAPPLWDCPRCGQPAGRDPGDPPGQLRAERYKTHLAYVQERRTPEQGEAILAEALATLHRRCGR